MAAVGPGRLALVVRTVRTVLAQEPGSLAGDTPPSPARSGQRRRRRGLRSAGLRSAGSRSAGLVGRSTRGPAIGGREENGAVPVGSSRTRLSLFSPCYSVLLSVLSVLAGRGRSSRRGRSSSGRGRAGRAVSDHRRCGGGSEVSGRDRLPGSRPGGVVVDGGRPRRDGDGRSEGRIAVSGPAGSRRARGVPRSGRSPPLAGRSSLDPLEGRGRPEPVWPALRPGRAPTRRRATPASVRWRTAASGTVGSPRTPRCCVPGHPTSVPTLGVDSSETPGDLGISTTAETRTQRRPDRKVPSARGMVAKR